MSEVRKLERFNKQKKVPRNDQFLFILYLKNDFFRLGKVKNLYRNANDFLKYIYIYI